MVNPGKIDLFKKEYNPGVGEGRQESKLFIFILY
jgi:hypothetical protein